MKKILLTGILSILFSGFSFAQTRFGITAGLNVSNFTRDVGDNNKFNKAGVQAGVVSDFCITRNFSIMPELLFSQRGANSGNVNTTLNYLQLPVNAAYKFNVGMGSKVFVFAGPYFGYGISGSDGVIFGPGGNKKESDFGVDVGVGYEYQKIFFKLQFNPGLININYPGPTTLSNYENNSLKNTNIAVSVGYFFNWIKRFDHTNINK